MFKNVMRGLGVCMLPVTYAFPTAVFCYWFTANSFSLGPHPPYEQYKPPF